MTPFSKNISITQIVKRWVWSQLCAFPNIKSPGNSQSSDMRCLYRRAKEFYGLKAYTIRRAAEAMGVFPKKNVDYSDEPTLGRPYMKGWRKDSQSWASIRNPVWSEARAKWDEGFCDYGKSAPESFIKAQRDEFQKEVEENLKAWFGQNGPDAREFFYPRPELYSGGYSADTVLHVARNIFIKDFLWRVKIDDEDQNGEDRFDAYEIEQLYGSILNELETSSRTLSRESFRIELYRCGITSEKTARSKELTAGDQSLTSWINSN